MICPSWHRCAVTSEKLAELRSLIRSYGSCLVAYSGGVDSVFLARVANDELGTRALAAIADSPSLPRRELREALEIAERFQIPIRVIKTMEFDDPNYISNPVNRCFYCKHELFQVLTPIARREGFSVIAYGENASDVGDFRPGARAAGEFGVRAPLKEVGLTKAEIRDLSREMGLPTADKPQMPCLSSRVPHGEQITPLKLRMIEAAEKVLRDLGFHDVRVRHHEPNGDGEPNCSTNETLARVEVGVSELPRLLADGMSAGVAEALKRIGYSRVLMDSQGYRRGKLSAAERSERTDAKT